MKYPDNERKICVYKMLINSIPSISHSSHSKHMPNNETNVIGYDDDVSRLRRNYIREHYNTYKMPYQSIYESEGRMSEYQLNNLLKQLNHRPNYVSDKKMQNIPLTGIEMINKNSYRGCSPMADLKSVKLLKDAGIKHIVDIEGFEELKDECEKQNIKYSNFLIEEEVDFFDRDIFKTKNSIIAERTQFFRDIIGASPERVKQGVDDGLKSWEKSKRNMIEYFTDFIKTMQAGNVYIGCKCGTIRTDIALMLNQLFNPKQANFKNNIEYNQKLLDNAVILYKNLDDTDKLKMGWNDEFDKHFLDNIEKLGRKF